ncbi:hypothetical protein QBC47DRAFT_390720 [Echria macrotheca]|uniref:C2H2-type domain-containing protein n=1 Tax=Echria macrotheca TaxID=438768 RepID=A0AAJ0B5N1_9PEZI|nr:hypothetical protein QBC47DRAFT_390720 [Echria macrotheca]
MESEQQAAGYAAPRDVSSGTDIGPASPLYDKRYPYRCDRLGYNHRKEICGILFLRLSQLNWHVETRHDRREPNDVRCFLCRDERTFDDPEDLTQHYRARHPDVECPRWRIGDRPAAFRPYVRIEAELEEAMNTPMLPQTELSDSQKLLSKSPETLEARAKSPPTSTAVLSLEGASYQQPPDTRKPSDDTEEWIIFRSPASGHTTGGNDMTAKSDEMDEAAGMVMELTLRDPYIADRVAEILRGLESPDLEDQEKRGKREELGRVKVNLGSDGQEGNAEVRPSTPPLLDWYGYTKVTPQTGTAGQKRQLEREPDEEEAEDERKKKQRPAALTAIRRGHPLSLPPPEDPAPSPDGEDET